MTVGTVGSVGTVRSVRSGGTVLTPLSSLTSLSPLSSLPTAVLLSLLSAAPAVSAQTPPDLTSLDSLITARLTATGTPGASVAVVAGGQLVYAKGFGVANVESGERVTAETLFRIGSVTKMFTGALLVQLAETGKVDLQAPISRYVPELAGKRVGSVTTHQLLTHQAGWLDNAVPYGRMGEAALGEVMREVTDTLFMTEPGRILSYSNPGFSMAGYVAEQAAGKRYGTLMEELVLRPAGMARSTFRPLAAMTMPFAQGHLGPAGQPARVVRPFTENTAQWAAGFLFSNAGEVARFAMLLMQGGSAEGREVLAPGAVRRMTTGHVVIPGLGATGSRYGYGLMVGRRDTLTTWQHGGAINGFQAQVVMVPSQGFAVVVLTNRGGSALPEVVEHAALLVLGVGQPRPAVDSGRAATEAERRALAGRYAHGGIQVEILERDGGLFLRQGGGELPVRMRGSDRIEVTPPGAPPTVVVIVPGPDGRIAYLHQGMRAIPRQP